MNEAIILSGRSNPKLAEQIAHNLGLKVGTIIIENFADGEINMEIVQNLRGKHVYIVQPTSPPVNESYMELFLLIATAKRASARIVTAIVPYYGYARQDRQLKPRVPISAADVACLLCSMHPDRVISIDLHCAQIQGFFPSNVVMENLDSATVGLPYIINLNLKKPIVISPDGGGIYRAHKVLDLLNIHYKTTIPFAMLNKHREKANEIAYMVLVGNVNGCDAIIVDDLIDTAGTLCEAARHLIENGANSVYAFATHGLFNGKAIERISNSVLTKVIVTDTVAPKKEVLACEKIKIVSTSTLLSDCIRDIHMQESIYITAS